MRIPSPLRKVAWSLGGRAAARWFRDVAEGQKGDRLKRIYWALAGGKTWTGFGVGLVAAVALGLGEMQIAAGLAAVAGFLSGVGLVDAAWRTGVPTALKASLVYRFLAANSAELAMLLAAISATAATCDPETAEILARVRLTCDGLTHVLLGTAAGLAWLGLYDSAGAAEPPATPLEQ